MLKNVQRLLGSMQSLASPYVWARAPADTYLFELEEELAAALHQLEAAKTKLSQVDRRLARMQACDRATDLPGWYTAAEEAESSAAAIVEVLHSEIAATRAHTKAGLALKLRLLANLFTEDVGDIVNVIDGTESSAELLRSVLTDLEAA